MGVFTAVIVAATILTIHGIPIPTREQAIWQNHQVAALIHFNMATYVGGNNGCADSNWNTNQNTSSPHTFWPAGLNVSNWIDSMRAIGVKHTILTAKHGCGFLLWNTKTLLPSGKPYGYNVGSPTGFPRDVADEYVATMRAAGLGYGFYYSTGNNFYLNRVNFDRRNYSLPNQVDVTDDEYKNIVLAHLEELWSRYKDDLTEIWFDGGYGSFIQANVTKMLSKLQPQAVGFNGRGVSASAARWIGTESGMPTYPVWSTSDTDGTGDPNSNTYIPAVCDTTLQQYDEWFFDPNVAVRPLSELIQVYHQSVGQNCLLEMDFAIDKTGNVDPKQAAQYAALGKWISSCYGTPVASTTTQNTLTIPSGSQIDRAVLLEDITAGQRIRTYSLVYNGKVVGNGTSVGTKRIHLLSTTLVGPGTFVLQITGVQPILPVQWGVFSPCPSK